MKFFASNILKIIFLVFFVSPPLALGHFNFFGFGSSAEKEEPKPPSELLESSSSNTASQSAPPPSTPYTSFSIGTGNAQSPKNVKNVGSGGGGVQFGGGASGPQIPYRQSGAQFSPPQRPSHQTPQYNAQTLQATKNQVHLYPGPTVPQPNSARMPVHRPNLSPSMATHSSGMSLVNQGHSQSLLAPPTRFSIGQNLESLSGNGNKLSDEGQGKNTVKKGTFNWESPEGQLYEITYVADAIPNRAQQQLAPPMPSYVSELLKDPKTGMPVYTSYSQNQNQLKQEVGVSNTPTVTYSIFNNPGTSSTSYSAPPLAELNPYPQNIDKFQPSSPQIQKYQ